ncbi:MAG: hypothetical protein NTY13_00165 [Chlamydiae bacterium]|nr:hypothetical protein [Chlamydiota bacterium]
MDIATYTKNYFNMFNEIRQHTTSISCKALAVLKIASLFTLVVPLTLGLLYLTFKNRMSPPPKNSFLVNDFSLRLLDVDKDPLNLNAWVKLQPNLMAAKQVKGRILESYYTCSQNSEPGLIELNLSGLSISQMPPCLTRLNLKSLNCSNCLELTQLPDLPNCRQLNCFNCPKLTQLPKLPSGTHLTCSSCIALKELPDLPNCTQLNCSNCPELTKLPKLPSGTHLTCSSCTALKELPELAKGIQLNCSNCPKLTKLPELPNCTHLTCSNCTALKELPELPSATYLRLHNCDATQHPKP